MEERVIEKLLLENKNHGSGILSRATEKFYSYDTCYEIIILAIWLHGKKVNDRLLL